MFAPCLRVRALSILPLSLLSIRPAGRVEHSVLQLASCTDIPLAPGVVTCAMWCVGLPSHMAGAQPNSNCTAFFSPFSCVSAVDQSSRQTRDFALAYAQPWASLLQLFGGVPLVDRCVAGWICPQQELYSSCWLRYLPGCGSAVARQSSNSPLAGYGKVQHWVATGRWLGHICASCNEPPCTI